MQPTIAYTRDEESSEAKVRWFRSLSLQERMDMLCEFVDVIVAVNPRMMEQSYAQPITGRVQVLTAP